MGKSLDLSCQVTGRSMICLISYIMGIFLKSMASRLIKKQREKNQINKIRLVSRWSSKCLSTFEHARSIIYRRRWRTEEELSWATSRYGRMGTSSRRVASMQPERKVSSCHISFLVTKLLDQKRFLCV